jgi:DNA-binding transcriptional LysR family regulator
LIADPACQASAHRLPQRRRDRRFAAAGRKIGRATSAISYTIAHLGLQLGLPLFDRDRTSPH